MIKFKDIKSDYVAIEFENSFELKKLVEYLKKCGYDYGTGGSNIYDISNYLGVEYFGNKCLSLDRSRQHHPRGYVSCGKGYRDACYKFSEIDWEEIE